MLKLVEISMNQELRTLSSALPNASISIRNQIASPDPAATIWLWFYSVTNTRRNLREHHGTIPCAPVPPRPIRPAPPRAGIFGFFPPNAGGAFLFAAGGAFLE